MPILGYGVYQASQEKCERCVLDGLEVGCRSLDTAQVMLRWNIQRGVVVLPKSTHRERMIENLNVFDFSLTGDDLSRQSRIWEPLHIQHNIPGINSQAEVHALDGIGLICTA